MPDTPLATRPWRAHWPVVVLALVAAGLALWARHVLFPAYSWNRDEPVYLWHVDILRSGHLTVSDGGYPGLFRPWLSAAVDGEMFTQYTLGWPLVLLASAVLTGSAGSALLVGAALAVIGTYALGVELLGDRRVATLGAALMVASPILPIQGGAYLSYLFTLGLGLLFGTLLLNGIRTARMSRAVMAGALVGWIFMTRPYDAVLWSAAFGAYAVIRTGWARWRRVVSPLLVCAVAALPLVALTLAYNHRVTGSWLGFPITTTEPSDTFGFGPRRLMPGFPTTDYQLSTAVKATAKNAFLLPWFLVGGYAGLAIAGAGLWQRRREHSTIALLLIGAVFPVGYFVFWGNHQSSLASRISGPIYFVPLYAPICLLLASALIAWWPGRRRLAVGSVAVLALATVPGAATRFSVNRDISMGQVPWQASAATIDDRALVFVADTGPYLLFTNPYSSNAPGLDGRILYAAENGPQMLDLISDHPDRRPLLQQASIASQDLGPSERPAKPQVSLIPIDVRRGGRFELSLRVAPSPRSERSSLVVDTGGTSITRRVSARGTAESILLVAPGAPGDLVLADRGIITITLDGAEGRERAVLVYRVVDGTIEVLLPVARHAAPPADTGEWRRALTLSRLGVDVTAR
ncbi:MAG: hypothetical protein ACT452_13155 [Microthrixaceae bacterium]